MQDNTADELDAEVPLEALDDSAVVPEMAYEVLKALRTASEGGEAAIVGEVRNDLGGAYLKPLLEGGGLWSPQ